MRLIEREDVLQTLETKFESIKKGEGHCILLSGEAGIGKTSLIKSFSKEKKDHCKVYQGTCDALFTPRPLAPVFDIIWQMSNNTPGNELHNLDRTLLFNHLFYELEQLSVIGELTRNITL